jgi:hypothetical protein
MQREHFEFEQTLDEDRPSSGKAASSTTDEGLRRSFVTRNYRLRTSPMVEYEFVAGRKGAAAETLGAGLDSDDKELPRRQFLSSETLLATAVERMQLHGRKISKEEFAAIGLRREEVIALRLYTGPCYQLYNAALRKAAIAGGKGEGGEQTSAEGVPFVTTVHLINSGLLKLSKLQQCVVVYRGIGGVTLPEVFREPNKDGAKGGVEFGFMSCSTKRDVALGYAAGKECGGTLLKMKMGMFHKGAQLNWLSQYPEEEEILFPPLTGIEVTGDPRVTGAEGAATVELFPVQLTTNLQSMEIEKLLALRKLHHMQTLSIFRSELHQRKVPPSLMQGFALHQKTMAARDGSWFNNDVNFSDAVNRAIQVLRHLPRCIFAFLKNKLYRFACNPHRKKKRSCLPSIPRSKKLSTLSGK